jgi:hypothetical protein
MSFAKVLLSLLYQASWNAGVAAGTAWGDKRGRKAVSAASEPEVRARIEELKRQKDQVPKSLNSKDYAHRVLPIRMEIGRLEESIGLENSYKKWERDMESAFKQYGIK